ncbi:MAG: selenocysteine-specific translation elongation factor [Chloroflexi bacterium]|nr:MAG: selenocysteine-specific translation elongation factor [Chloroflexota bacterium]RLC96063.1 MAG: selenocysteine-specific translation elongation factor [Chloroflexota bacterium]
MFVLGTAGHVDHGKSALIQALTGIDPDRLREEKERGMTIDLGFAWLKLPSGREVSIVDVPGHERFIKNMLAGVGGIDLALLVVAADEGVMPQTREHLAILDLLRVERGVVVITKKDLVDEELLDLVVMEVKEVLESTTLAQAPILTTSAATREGLTELINAIDEQLDSTPPRRDIGRPRLPIDRVFTMSGFGTVVTGTLLDGELAVGQEIEIAPHGLRSRVRGLQIHKTKVDRVQSGRRVAVNLPGVATGQLTRGDVLTTPGWLVPTSAVDARIRLLGHLAHPLRHNTTITFHSNAVEVEARARLLDREELKPGESGWAQFALARPVALVKGDLFIIRSTTDTLGGGEVVDAYPRRHRRFHAATIAVLEAREKGSPEQVLLADLESRQPATLGELLRRSGLSSREAEETVKSLASQGKIVLLGDKGPQTLAFSAAGWDRLAEKARQAVGEHHRRFPLRRGLPKEELKSRLRIPPQSFSSALRQLVQDGVLSEDGNAVCLPSFRIELNKEQQAAADRLLESLSQSPYSPSADVSIDPAVLDYLVEQRQVMKLADNVIFTAAAYDEMVERVIDHIKSRGKITVAEVRDLFQTSRKYALALMEHLDERKVTRRVGDERVLR